MLHVSFTRVTYISLTLSSNVKFHDSLSMQRGYTALHYAVAGEQYKLVNIILTHPEVNIDEQATVRILMFSSSTVKVVIFLCSCVVLNWHIQPVFNHFTLRTTLTTVWNYLGPLHLHWHHNLQTNSCSHSLLYMTSLYEPIIASNSLWLWLYLK